MINFVKTADVARALKITDRTVTRWIKSKGLPARRFGAEYLIDVEELNAWINANCKRYASAKALTYAELTATEENK